MQVQGRMSGFTLWYWWNIGAPLPCSSWIKKLCDKAGAGTLLLRLADVFPLIK